MIVLIFNVGFKSRPKLGTSELLLG